jgi:hypothetical protein
LFFLQALAARKSSRSRRAQLTIQKDRLGVRSTRWPELANAGFLALFCRERHADSVPKRRYWIASPLARLVTRLGLLQSAFHIWKKAIVNED